MPPPTPPPMAAAFELEENDAGASLEGAYGKGVGEAVAGSDPPMHEPKDHIAPGTVHVHAVALPPAEVDDCGHGTHVPPERYWLAGHVGGRVQTEAPASDT